MRHDPARYEPPDAIPVAVHRSGSAPSSPRPERLDCVAEAWSALVQDGGEQTPVLVHRAILGSLERMISMLVQHYAGNWPLWLSPRHVCILPISSRFASYAEHVLQRCREASLYADMDAADTTLGRRMRNALQLQYNRILVVGENESRDQTVAVRDRDRDDGPVTMSAAEFITQTTRDVALRK